MSNFGVERNELHKDELLELVAVYGLVVVRQQSLDDLGLQQVGKMFGYPIRPISLPSVPTWVLAALSDELRGHQASAVSSFLAKGANEWCIILDDVRITVPFGSDIIIKSLCIGERTGLIDQYDQNNQIDIIKSVGSGALQLPDIWHADASYFEEPPSFGVFYADIVPGDGSGETLFCDMVSALASFSPALQSLLSQCFAVHVADAHLRRHGQQRGRKLAIPAVPSPVEHPIVRSITTNRKSLYVNPFFTEKLVGFNNDESDALLSLLFDKCMQPEFIYCHRWRPGDVVIWDNRATMHYSVRNVTKGERRRLKRVLVGGERPAA